MRKIFSYRKMNNKGSSLFLVLVSIIFVTLLASTVMAVSLSNYFMKRVEEGAKKSFYTAETAVDAIYSTLGDCALNSVSSAYVDQLSEIVKMNGTGGYTIVDNEAANKEMKENFVRAYLHTITYDPDEVVSIELDSSNYYSSSSINYSVALKHVKNYVNRQIAAKLGIVIDASQDPAEQLKSGAGISVSSVGSFYATANDPEYCITLSDVVINYESSQGYFADITTDFMIRYPELDVNFDNTKDLEFLNYSLIAEKNLAFGKADDTTVDGDDAITVKANALAGMYAGQELSVNGGSTLTIANGSKTVAHGQISVESDDTTSTLLLGKSTVWTRGDLLLEKFDNASVGAVLTAGEDSALYVGDDLEFIAEQSTANIAGEYHGYGYNVGGNNSSIILNGRFATLSVTSSVLEILGRAFVDIDSVSSVEYENAESVNAKDMQAIYLVQDIFLQSTVTNPISSTSVPEAVDGKYQTLIDYDKMKDEFFAWSLLDASAPVVVKNDSYAGTAGLSYLYYNFSSAENREKYVQSLLTGELNGVNVRLNTSWIQANEIYLRSIRRTFYNYETSTYMGGVTITSPATGILGYYPSKIDASASENNRITLKDGELNDSEASSRSVSVKNKLTSNYKIMANQNVYSEIINAEYAEAQTLSDITCTVDGNDYILRLIHTDDASVSISRGIIVHTGNGTLTVKNGFHGMIISNGTINVADSSGGTVTLDFTTDSETLKQILESSDAKEFAQLFKEFYTPSEANSFSIENIGYDDIIFIQNWRKFED